MNDFNNIDFSGLIKNLDPIGDIRRQQIQLQEDIINSVAKYRTEKEEQEERKHEELIQAIKDIVSNVEIKDVEGIVQVMSNTNNCVQNANTDQQFDYAKAKDVLEEIKGYFNTKQFDDAFTENSEKMKEIVKEAIIEVDRYSDPSLVQKAFYQVYKLANSVGSNLIASGIIQLITPFIIEIIK